MGGGVQGVSWRRQLSVVAWVYVIEGFPMGVYQSVFGVYFRRHDVALSAIGLLGMLQLAWSLKALWSPGVERFGERQDWIRAALAAMAVALCAVAWLPPNPIGPLLACALALYCAASATQDIAIDGYTIGLIDRGREGPVNALRMVTYRVGMVLSGSALLLLPGWIGWPQTFVVAAVASLLMAATLSATPAIPLPPSHERRPLHALHSWLGRPGLASMLGFVLLFRIGDKALGPMIAPFWVDRGFSNEEIALFSSALGALATLAGAVAGGWLVARRGIVASLWMAGTLALVSNLAYAAAAWWPESGRLGVYLAAAVEAATSGAVGVAFLSYLMRVCEKEHAAVQYAALTGVYALAGSLLAGASGWFTEWLGYAPYFALTAAFAAPAFALLRPAARWMLPEAAPEAAAQR